MFPENVENTLMRFEKDDKYIEIKIENTNKSKINKKNNISKLVNHVSYKEIINGIDIEYTTFPNKIKETIVLYDKKYKKIEFKIYTNLELKETAKSITAYHENKSIFEIEKPYMQDSKGNKNTNIYYNLAKQNNYYTLELILDEKWLTSKNVKFPVYIDPTITNVSQGSDLKDTYIFPGDEGIDKNSQDILKAGIEQINGSLIENRALIKFALPEIGTGSEIVSAGLNLIGYIPSDNHDIATEKLVSVHRITADWNETTATWENMSTNFDNKIEDIFLCSRSSSNGLALLPQLIGVNITNLVKKWYRNVDNFGIMLQSVKKDFVDNDYQAFFSSNNTVTGNNPQPIFYVVYKNYNGLEEYLDYKIQSFTNGLTYINTFNGNMVATFNLGNTIGGHLPANLSLVYNTNDVVLENKTFFGKGYKLNLEQIIRDSEIENCLEYIDEDGTIHYFIQQPGESNKYIDEDGLKLTIEKNESKYIMSDKNGGSKIFLLNNGIYYLSEIKDVDSNTITIERDAKNRINKVKDKYNAEIRIVYGDNVITITSPEESVILTYSNTKLISVETNKGITNIEYNDNNLISSITDVTGLKVTYEYYNKSPYRMWKVTQYGINNKIGNNFTLEYGFDSTIIINNTGKTETIIYNSYGNVLSRNSLKSSEDINGAYSYVKEYGSTIKNNQNKIVMDSIPVTYIKNFLKNTSFENDTNNFISDEEIQCSFSTEYSKYGNRSLKLVSTISNKGITQLVEVPKGKNYTFSSYIKNTNKVKLSLSYDSSNGKEISKELQISQEENFEREDLSIFYDESATSNLKIRIELVEPGTAYIDNVQLEEGEVANLYNFIENSDFSEGLNDWNCNIADESLVDETFSVVKFNNGLNTTLKINMNPLYGSGFGKTFPVNGKKGDLFTVSFWYKNAGIPVYQPHGGNYVVIYFEPVDGETEFCFIESPNLNSNDSIWQYYSYSNYALEDFTNVKLNFIQQDQANNFYITNISLIHNTTNGFYEYDENGNLITSTNASGNKEEFKYSKDNQLISAIDTSGKILSCEYDNQNSERMINAISVTGTTTNVIYDDIGNPITTKNYKTSIDELTDGVYKIRSKGTRKYIKAELNMLLLEENQCSNTMWKLEKVGDFYKIVYDVQPSYSISCNQGIIALDKSNINNLFTIEKNDDGSYYIIFNESNNDEKIKRYLKSNNDILQSSYINVEDESIKFYIEPPESVFIEQNAKYTEDGRFVTSVTDSNFNEIKYNTDPNTGLMTSITDPNGTIIEYTYNNQNQITSVLSEDKEIKYKYNDKNLLSKIIQDNKTYEIQYDEFLRQLRTVLNNNIYFSTNEYDNSNGKLLSTTFGNGDKVTYEYDEFGRIIKVNKKDTSYSYKYDSNGDLSKIYVGTDVMKYYYDKSKRLYKFKNQGKDFIVNFTYDNDDNIICKNYYLKGNPHSQNITMSNDRPIEVNLDGKIISYTYDSLDRTSTKNINNICNTNYEYITHGKRTTDLVKTYATNNNTYSYDYDKLGNIINIYYNNEIIKHYEYDKFSQLIGEINYDFGNKVEYTYSNSGNILQKVITDLDTNNIIKSYTATYTNQEWEDQLTSFDGYNIEYDAIGNPTKIANAVLTWNNGKELSSYIDNSYNININYTYGLNGIRESKTINNKEIKFHYMNNDLVFEERGNNIIYYLYDLESIIGLEYQNNKYYYLKNNQNDVTGIIDEEGNQIVKYKYDSWGNLITIEDNNGNTITDQNNIGHINPFRYRSYYYDEETKLYYLNNRYYNPKWGRFISPDSLLGANKDFFANNLYLYVSNNPINRFDLSGQIIQSLLKWGHKQLKKIKKTKIYKKIKKALTLSTSVTTTKNVPLVNKIKRTFTMDISTESGGTKTEYINNSDSPFSIDIGSDLNNCSGTVQFETSRGNFSYSISDKDTSSFKYQSTINSNNKRQVIEFGSNYYSFYIQVGDETIIDENDTTFTYTRITISKVMVLLTVLSFGEYGIKVSAKEIVTRLPSKVFGYVW